MSRYSVLTDRCRCAPSLFLVVVASALLLGLTNCGSGNSGGSTGTTGGSGGTTTFSITAASSTVLLGNTVQFTGNQTVTGWTVNGAAGGSAAVGTISASGLYTAPTILPSNAAITIGATSATSSATASLTVTSDIVVSITDGAANAILTSSTLNLTGAITSAGHPSTAVTWTVNGVPNGNAQVGTITPGSNGAAVYAAPAVQPSSPVQISATSVADTTKSATLNLSVQGILPSANSGTPGQAIVLSGAFNASEPLLVTFSDGGDFNPSIEITPSSATQATFVVPLYIASSGIAEGTVTISATQESGSGVVTIGSSPGFSIDVPPAAPGSAGTVSLAVLNQVSAATAQAENDWALIGEASNGAVNVSGLTAGSIDMNAQHATLAAAISSIAAGGAAVQVGAEGVNALQLDASSLASMDAILQAFVVENPSVQAAIDALPRKTRRALHVPASGRTPAESLRAFTALSPQATAAAISLPTMNLYLATLCLALEATTPLGAGVAVIGAAEPFLEYLYNLSMTYAAGNLFSGQSAAVEYSLGQLGLNSVDSALGNAQITLSGPWRNILTDLQNLNNLFTSTSSSSPGTQANADEPGLQNNVPPSPGANSTPYLLITYVTTLENGGFVLDVQVFNAPANASYTLNGSWGESDAVQLDAFGNAWHWMTTPPPNSGACYQGTVSLLDSAGSTAVSFSSCFAPTTIEDISLTFCLTSDSGIAFLSFTGSSNVRVGPQGLGGTEYIVGDVAVPNTFTVVLKPNFFDNQPFNVTLAAIGSCQAISFPTYAPGEWSMLVESPSLGEIGLSFTLP